MKRVKITDLEEFSLRHVWRPFQSNDIPDYKSPPHNLEETAQILSENSEWSNSVLSRIRGIGIYFPPYIKHPLVDVVNEYYEKYNKV